MDLETSLRVLTVLSDALTVPHTLDQALQHIATMTGVLMETGQTVLLMRDVDRHELIVRTGVGIESRGVRVGHPLDVPERLKHILWRIRSLHQINWVDSGIPDIGFPILVVPLRIGGEVVGLLLTGKSTAGGTAFNAVQRRLAMLVATFAALAIERAKVYDYLRQQFAQRSQELMEANRRDTDSGGDETQRLMISSLTNPNKVVRLLAESFYKELVRAGFAPGHITTATAQILECITREDRKV